MNRNKALIREWNDTSVPIFSEDLEEMGHHMQQKILVHLFCIIIDIFRFWTFFFHQQFSFVVFSEA